MDIQKTVIYLCSTFVIFSVMKKTSAVILPTIFWDSTDLLFQCDVPTLRVRFGDLVELHCPLINASADSQPSLVVENMFHVESREQFEACNATGGIQLLRCSSRVEDNRCVSGAKCSKHYNMLFTQAMSPLDVNFERGKMYYFIGTGFRTSQNIDNTQGGSCERTNGENEGRLRLRVYVCTEDEASRGECERPTTLPAYYKNCNEPCGQWRQTQNVSYENLTQECTVVERRECFSTFTGVRREEIRLTNIPCPRIVCGAWRNTSNRFYVDGKCLKEEGRECINVGSNLTSNETRNVEVACEPRQCKPWVREIEKVYQENGECFLPEARYCYQPWVDIETKECRDLPIKCDNETITSPQTGKSTSEDDVEYKIYIIAIVISGIISLLVGLIFGSALQKCHVTKKLEKMNEEAPGIQLVATQGVSDNGVIVGTLPRNSSVSVPMYVIDGVIDGIVSPTETLPEEDIDDAETVSTDIGKSDSETPKASQTDDDDVFYPQSSHLPRAIQKQQRHRNVSRQLSATRVVLVRNVSDASAYQQRVTRLSYSDGRSMTRASKSASNIEFVQHI